MLHRAASLIELTIKVMNSATVIANTAKSNAEMVQNGSRSNGFPQKNIIMFTITAMILSSVGPTLPYEILNSPPTIVLTVSYTHLTLPTSDLV